MDAHSVSVGLVVVIIIAALLFDYTNGFHDAANSIATVVATRVLSPGLVSPEMREAWVREKGGILRGGGLDESPHAYRRLPSVLAAQQGTIEILHTLRPLVVVMAGAEEFDPYKD